MLRPPGAPSLSRRNLPFYSVDSFLVFALVTVLLRRLIPFGSSSRASSSNALIAGSF